MVILNLVSIAHKDICSEQVWYQIKTSELRVRNHD